MATEAREAIDAREQVAERLRRLARTQAQLDELTVELERELFLSGLYKAFGMGAGPCGLCDTCTFDEGCRHPRQARR